jgi:CHAD domain-containing protein
LSYRIDLKKPLEAQIRAIAGGQIEQAREALSRHDYDPDETVRQARKRFKKVRGLYRLIRDGAPDFYADENARFGDMARQLGGLRDAAALVETADRLIAETNDSAPRQTLHAIRDRLAQRSARIAAEDAGLNARIADTSSACGDAVAALEGLCLPQRKKGAKVLRRGAVRVYKKLYRQHEHACETGKTQDYHALRKWMKYHWMHMRLLRDVWPGEMALRADAAKAVADALGRDHDAALLGDMATRLPEVIGTQSEIDTLLAAVTAHGTQLHDRIERPLSQLCAAPPDDFSAIMRRLIKQAL